MNYLCMKVIQKAYRLESNNIKDDKDLYQGLRSRADGWPDDAAAFVDARSLKVHKKADRTPPDFFWGMGHAIVLSARAKELIGDVQGGEYLPIAIFDEKKQPLEASYYVLNIVGLVDCLDLPNCAYEQDDVEYVSVMERMTVDEIRIPPDRSLFRMRHYPRIPLVHRHLAEKILQAGFTGVEFCETGEFTDLE